MSSDNELGFGRVVKGACLYAPQRDTLEVIDDAVIQIGDDGVIQQVLRPDSAGRDSLLASARERGALTVIPAPGFLIPGLVDLHIHAPQWPQLGKALHLPLEDWLQQATFPLESRYADVAFATSTYHSLVSTLLANGTTTAVYFATLHDESTRVLADTCIALGQRALVGRVAMDHPDECPDFYRDESADAAVRGTDDLIAYLAGAGKGRVLPAITPRFIPSCTDELLTGLGELAAQHGCHVQTHCSESDWEHHHVLQRMGCSDTEALHSFGLVQRQSVLAHASLLGNSDMDLIKTQGAGVAHCPLSNIYFSSAVFPLRRALEKGLHIGLGTDISGGPSASMFETCRHTVHSARMLELGVDARMSADERGVPESRIDFIEAFYLATAGGAEVLDLLIGRFEPGYRFDAVHIDPDATDGGILRFDGLDSTEDLLQKTLYGATRSNIAAVWVDGRAVVEARE